MRGLSNFRTGFPTCSATSHGTVPWPRSLPDAGWPPSPSVQVAPGPHGRSARPPDQPDQWAPSAGFDRFYGFLDGERRPVPPVPSPSTTTTSTRLQLLLRRLPPERGPGRPGPRERSPPHQRQDPTGRSHLVRPRGHPRPHQAPPPYRDKYRGATTRVGTPCVSAVRSPEGSSGSSRPHRAVGSQPGVEAWEAPRHRATAGGARLQEAFAAPLDHTDDQIGRLLDGLRDSAVPTTPSSLVSRQRGQPGGRPVRRHARDEVLQRHPRDAGAGDRPHRRHRRPPQPHQLPVGWAQCGNSPFRWYKQNTHEGGVHVLPIPALASGLADQAGTTRRQFAHARIWHPPSTSCVRADAPETYRGAEQRPITGRSFVRFSATPPHPH